MGKNRNTSIDIAKGIGIILMIIGHIGSICPDFFHSWIYSFHMPLFFFCSGLFAKTYLDNSIWKSIKHRLKTLLIPYFLYAAIFYVGDEITGFRYYTFDDILDTFKGYDPFNFLWFLYALFFISILFVIISFVSRSHSVLFSIVVFLFSICGWGLHIAGCMERLGSIFFGLIFYYSGYIFKKRYLKIYSWGDNIKYVIIVCSLFISIIGTHFLTKVTGNARKSIDLHHNEYPDIFMTYVIAMSGIMLILYLSKLLSINIILARWISLVGRESLIIYPVFTYVPLRLEYVLRVESGIIKLYTKLFAIILCTILIIIKRGNLKWKIK